MVLIPYQIMEVEALNTTNFGVPRDLMGHF